MNDDDEDPIRSGSPSPRRAYVRPQSSTRSDSLARRIATAKHCHRVTRLSDGRIHMSSEAVALAVPRWDAGPLPLHEATVGAFGATSEPRAGRSRLLVN